MLTCKDPEKYDWECTISKEKKIRRHSSWIKREECNTKTAVCQQY